MVGIAVDGSILAGIGIGIGTGTVVDTAAVAIAFSDCCSTPWILKFQSIATTCFVLAR